MKRRSEFLKSPVAAAVGGTATAYRYCHCHCIPSLPARYFPWLLPLLALLLSSCTDDPVPKPRGYFRLDLPASSFRPWQGACPFAAEIPAYALMVDKPGNSRPDTACWTSMRFPDQHASIYLSYRRIANDLPELINDAHTFKDKHEAKAARIRSERVAQESTRVFGTLFDVEGDVASPMVFYLTDSTTHFLYGSLYFDARPNADSLEPVNGRIQADIRHFAATLEWH